MNDVIVPLAPINFGRIRRFLLDDDEPYSPSAQQIELDITDEHTPILIKVPRHQMLIEISAEGVFIKSEPR